MRLISPPTFVSVYILIKRYITQPQTQSQQKHAPPPHEQSLIQTSMQVIAMDPSYIYNTKTRQ